MNGLEHSTPGIVATLLLTVLVLLWSIRRARNQSEKLYIRRIPGIDAIDEAVGRSAELGRPVCFCTGLTSLGPVLYACLGVLHYVARKAAIYKSKLLLPQTAPEAMAVVEETARDAYRSVGRTGNFDPDNVVYLTDEQFAFASGYMGLVHREQIGSAFLFGHFAAESLILSDAGQQVGAMQVAATTDPDQVAFFICTCDYTLIGEELFGASAYLSREPILVGSLLGQDIMKAVFLVLIVCGVVISTIQVFRPEMGIPNIDKLFAHPWSFTGSFQGRRE